MFLESYGPLLVNALMVSLTYILIALGLTLIFGIMGIVNFAHGEFYMLGAFGVYFAYTVFHMNFFAAIVLSAVAMAALGIACEKGLFYRVRGDFIRGFLIAMGLSIVIQSATQLGVGPQIKSFPPPYPQVFRFTGMLVVLQRLIPAVGGAALAAALLLFIRRTKTGQMLLAVAQDMDAAALQGIDVSKARAVSWGVACGLAAAAGGLMAPLSALTPYIGGAPLMNAFGMVIIGGLGSIPGVIAAGFLLGAVQGIGGAFISSSAVTLIWFGLMIAILLFRPQGLLGRA